MTADTDQPVLDLQMLLRSEDILELERSFAQVAEWIADDTVGRLRVTAVHAIIDAAAHGCAGAHVQAWIRGRGAVCCIAISEPWWRPQAPRVLDDLSDRWRCAYGVLHFEIDAPPAASSATP